MCGIVNGNFAKMVCKYTYKGFIDFNVHNDLLAKERHKQDKMHGIFVNICRFKENAKYMSINEQNMFMNSYFLY